MAIAVKVKCSECGFEHAMKLGLEQEEIVCLSCGRRMQNLTEDEFSEIEAAQKRQRMMSIVALVCFAVALVCFGMWVGPSATWVSTDNTKYWQELGATRDVNSTMMAGAAVMGLASLVFGVLGSLKRFVVEY